MRVPPMTTRRSMVAAAVVAILLGFGFCLIIISEPAYRSPSPKNKRLSSIRCGGRRRRRRPWM